MEAVEFTDCDKELWGDQSSGEELELENRLRERYLRELEEFNTQIPNHEKHHSRKEDYDQCSRRRDADSSIELARGLSSLDISLEPDKVSSYKFQSPVQASVARDTNYNPMECEFLKLQEANNISKAAFKEIMALALEANTWVVGTPALGAIEEFQQRFRSPPLPGMRVERSVETAIVPIAPKNLVSFLMDVDRWVSTLSNIVHHGSSHSPTGVLSQLINADETIMNVVMVNVEFQMPTPFVPMRKFCFLRFLRQVIPDIWAIVDVSNDYFHHRPSDSTLEVNCQRRPSGVIIRRCDECSEVIWIENVEVYKHQGQENMYSTVVNSNLAFCAKRWVRTLLRKLKRNNSRFFNLKVPLSGQAHAYLLNLTECMEKVYFECINEAPNITKWDILSDEGVRVLRDVTNNCVETRGSNNYIALTSFHVQAAPLSVFQFLVEKNFKLQWPSLQEEPEEVFEFATEDDSNCITLHKKVVSQRDSTEHHEYLLQEASRDEFCPFVISSPMTRAAISAALFLGEWRYDFLKPSGFSIMHDGSGGLQSDASLVTITIQQELDVLEAGPAIEAMSNIIRRIIGEIDEAFTGGIEASRL